MLQRHVRRGLTCAQLRTAEQRRQGRRSQRRRGRLRLSVAQLAELKARQATVDEISGIVHQLSLINI